MIQSQTLVIARLKNPALQNNADQSSLPLEGSFLWTIYNPKGQENPQWGTSQIPCRQCTPVSRLEEKLCGVSRAAENPLFWQLATWHIFDGVRPQMSMWITKFWEERALHFWAINQSQAVMPPLRVFPLFFHQKQHSLLSRRFPFSGAWFCLGPILDYSFQ